MHATSNPSSSNGRHGFTNGDHRGLHQTSAPGAPPQVEIQRHNIVNQKAPENSSLFQICLNLRRRLAGVPGFQEHIQEMEEEEAEGSDTTDPVTTMWNCLRRGIPLLTLYNAFGPAKPLQVDSNVSEAKVTKHATFKFLQACITNLKIPAGETFLITDLYGENTTGFVKVTKVVNRVLDMLQKQGLLLERQPSASDVDTNRPQAQTIRQKIVNELVETERDYINHLENLQQFKKQLEQNGVLPGDIIHDIFLNLDFLLEFQRRFQVRLEQQYSSEENAQQWGKLFAHYAEPFKVYIPFIANQQTCMKTVSREWDRLSNAHISAELHGIVETQSVLFGFLSKPFHRLTKYPMLLSELYKKGEYDEDRMQDLNDGMERIRSILDESNEAIAKETRREAVEELQQRVEDWKGHKIDHFGELLLNGTYTVLKGEGAKEVEREYKVYLFERILLCCKEINPNKPKNKMLGTNKPLVDKKGKLKLQLKGRIFMQNVTDVLTLSRSDRASYTVQIFWKGDPGVENFVIRFPDETTMVNWRETVQSQQKRLSESRTSSQTGSTTNPFPWMTHQPPTTNPYGEDDDGDDDESHAPALGRPPLPVSRNASDSSLQSFQRPTTANPGRAPHPRMQNQDIGNGPFTPALSLITNVPGGASSPNEYAAGSYFSPTTESPMSTRISSQSSVYSFPRPAVTGSGWGHDVNKHRTAPAMGRAPSREGYARPSLPPTGGQHPTQPPTSVPQSRLRSASTPDIPNGNDPRSRRQPNGMTSSPMENVPVPPIPQNIRNPINRSQTTSPNNNAQLPIRGANNPPSYDARGQRLTQRHDMTSARQAAAVHGGPYGPATTSKPDLTPTSSVDDDDLPYPSQIKVKVWYDDVKHYVTIVVGNNIKYRTLADRIDSKMLKISSQAISRGSAKLVYEDVEGDVVSIQSDDDVQMAIEDWVARNERPLREKMGNVDDFELMWQERSST